MPRSVLFIGGRGLLRGIRLGLGDRRRQAWHCPLVRNSLSTGLSTGCERLLQDPSVLWIGEPRARRQVVERLLAIHLFLADRVVMGEARLLAHFFGLLRI